MLGACPDQSNPILVCAACRLAGWTAGCHAQVISRSDLAGLLTAAVRPWRATATRAHARLRPAACPRRRLRIVLLAHPVPVSANVGRGASRAVLSHVSRNDSTIGRLGIPAMSARRCTLRRFPGPCDVPKGWTSRPSRPKMHVQLSNHHRPSVRRAGPARQEPRRRIQSKGWRWRPLGCIACTVNGVRREAEVESRLLIDDFLRESLGAHQHC
jgi:hypothetical protein